MRKAQKQEVLDFINSLSQAHEEIKGALSQHNTVVAQNMLSEAQDFAVSLGNNIEKLEGAGHITVSYVEEYCELLYHVYEELSNQQYNENKIYKGLRKQLIKIENSVKNDITVRKEVVFFPYKASMWDSLESVYLKAKQDENCDAYCVPIPYYDLNPDHSFGQMHYEGREYPKNIEVIDWQTYNFEERKPDEIYIHSPYDNWNLVTSVHPRFYSSNLKKYTDKLVYIPYFILSEIEPDNQPAIDGMKHFIWLPGVINADKVIVQSEKMKQIYVNEYLKAAQANNMPTPHTDRAYLEQKILGLGSPKIDKVLNTKKEDLEIPPEWLKVIKKPDGTWKKIIFYNIGIASLLSNNDKWIEKIEDVLRIFKENQDDVALLWRPHPLIENTMRSMRPWILQKYMEIKSQYLREGWGIYDDTADMDRAVILSDAYYGDGSSIVQLYQKTGKPIMLQNVELVNREFDEKIEVGIEDAILYKDKVWFWAENFNGFFNIDIKTKESHFMGSIPHEEYWKRRLYTSMKLVGNKIFLIPFSATAITVYDLEKKTFGFIHMDENEIGEINSPSKFMGVENWKNFLFIFPASAGTIIRLNTDTYEMDYISSWVEEAKKICFDASDAFFRRQSVLMNGRIYIPFCNANAVLEMECNTLQTTIYQLGSESEGYAGICHDGECFWMISRNLHCVTRWNLESNQVRKTYLSQTKPGPSEYVGISCDLKHKRIFASRKHEKLSNERENIETADGIYTFVRKEDRTLFFERNSGTLTIEGIGRIPIQVSCKAINFKQMMRKNIMKMYEESTFNLIWMIQSIAQEEKYDESCILTV